MTKAQNLLLSYEDLDWETYIAISDRVVKVDKENLEKELVDQASLYSYYTGLRAFCKKQIEKKSIEIEQFGAKHKRVEEELKREKGERITDKILESSLLSSKVYNEKKNTLSDLQFKYNLLHSLCQALEQKKDCLVQLSANNRAESKLYDR